MRGRSKWSVTRYRSGTKNFNAAEMVLHYLMSMKQNNHPRLNILSCLFALAICATPVRAEQMAPGQPVSPQSEFMRIETVAGHRYLQMAAVVYEIPKFKARVTLYAAVHIADPQFYRDVQKRFGKYDAVLMEGIGASDKYGRSRRHLGMPFAALVAQVGQERASVEEMHDLYDAMATGLGLTGQMEAVDLGKKNFVFPDMSYSELEKHLDEAGVDYLMPEEQFIRPIIPMLQKFTAGIKSGGKRSPVMGNIIKNLMAEMILRMDMNAALSGEDEPSRKRREYFRVILEERNSKVVEAVDDALKKGKKNIAVFYGAMHLPGIKDDLTRDFGAREVSKSWLNALKLN